MSISQRPDPIHLLSKLSKAIPRLVGAFALILSFVAVDGLRAAPQNQAIRTSICRINVNQAGRVADQEALKDMYFFADGGGPGYLIDGSLILGNSATTMSWLIYEGLGGGPTGSNPFGYLQEQSLTTSHDTTSYVSHRFASGTGQNVDGTLGFKVDYYAPKHPDSGEFVIAHFEVAKGPTNPTGTVSGLTIAFASDWNVPSDVPTMNTSGYDPVKSLLYMQSTGASTGRMGATTAYRDDGGEVVGGFSWDNAVHVDPQNTFENDDLWSAMEGLSQDQFDAGAGTADFSSVIVIGRDIVINGTANDTFAFSVLLVADHQPLSPDKGLSQAMPLLGLQQTHDRAVKFMCDHVSSTPAICGGCPNQPGDANNTGNITISDVVYLFAFLCGGGGPAPNPLANGDADGDCDIDSCDIKYISDHIFFGGPAPVECTCENPVVIGCTCGSTGPDLCQNSTTDPVLLICPTGDELFHVYLKDENGDPVVGNSSVSLVFNNCSGVLTCPPSVPITEAFPLGPSDDDGMLVFQVAGGGCNVNCEVEVTADCGVIATVPVRSFDINGDFGVSDEFDWDFTECNNYDGLPGIGNNDPVLFLLHNEHSCGLSPCERFQAEFSLDPDFNLIPGDVIDLTLVLKNNNFNACHIGFIGFFSSGFGTAGTDQLIINYNYNQTLAPGAEDVVTVQYTVPGVGHGCLSVKFTTDCCPEHPVELTQCAQSTWHCAADAGHCYDVLIYLDGPDVENITFFENYPGPGWFINVIHEPISFPVTELDSVYYQICTPVAGSLGDEAQVIVSVDYPGFGSESFENRLFITKKTGDVNGDCIINISDVVYLIAYIFAGGPPPIPMQSGDVDCSNFVNISDAVYIVSFIFAGGPSPCLAE